jgi:colanic acid biosynthesis glycosyl transferase WcaI
VEISDPIGDVDYRVFVRLPILFSAYRFHLPHQARKTLRILLVTITYPPEIGGAAHLIHALALSLQQRGHQATILTAYPTYNLKEIPERYSSGLKMVEEIDGISVRRVRIPALARGSKLARGFQHFIFGLWLSGAALFSKRPDAILVFSPPLPLPWLVCLVGKIRRIPVVVNIQDLFPREAVELGILKSATLIRIFEMMERQVHRWAANITVHSPGNKEHVLQHGGSAERVFIVYNWVDTDLIQPRPKDNVFSQQYNLTDRFVVSYAGTMGWAQDMETIIDSAAQLRDNPQILFLLVGDGVEKEKAQKKAEALGLKNILWLPMQPFTIYPEILAASDVSLINLHPELRTPVVPSKLLSIMAAGRPVVASLPQESDARVIITEADCGIFVNAGDGISLANAIQKLASDPALGQKMGKRGRAYAEENFSREGCASQMESVLKQTVGGENHDKHIQ